MITSAEISFGAFSHVAYVTRHVYLHVQLDTTGILACVHRDGVAVPGGDTRRIGTQYALPSLMALVLVLSNESLVLLRG